jgi:hypothetical protein
MTPIAYANDTAITVSRDLDFLVQSASSGNTFTTARRRAYSAFLVCMTILTWILLVLVGLALAFSLLRFLVELISVLMLFIAGLWLLAAWLRIYEAQNP